MARIGRREKSVIGKEKSGTRSAAAANTTESIASIASIEKTGSGTATGAREIEIEIVTVIARKEVAHPLRSKSSQCQCQPRSKLLLLLLMPLQRRRRRRRQRDRGLLPRRPRKIARLSDLKKDVVTFQFPLYIST
mmetsp:Transcript_23015/g.34612  ORF Transcript_23015/g.34612 Transcript_23015/m.34612 type:complete len:135 (-) Transcript_23015:41-445(-)